MTDALIRRLRPSQVRELITLLIIIGLVIFFASQIDNYLSGRTFNRITTDFPIIAVVAVGQLLVVLTRNLDLSVGSQVALRSLVDRTGSRPRRPTFTRCCWSPSPWAWA